MKGKGKDGLKSYVMTAIMSWGKRYEDSRKDRDHRKVHFSDKLHGSGRMLTACGTALLSLSTLAGRSYAFDKTA